MSGKENYQKLMKELSLKLRESSWKNSVIYKKLQKQISDSLVCISTNSGDVCVTKYLITNKQYCDFLCSTTIQNNIGLNYLLINTHLYDSRIKNNGEEFFSSLKDLHTADRNILVTNNKFYVTPGYENHPVVCVTWLGAILFAQTFECNLPNLQQWTLIARGNHKSDTLYTWGNGKPTANLANYGEYIGHTTVVGSYPPNSVGVYDLLGNVREWLVDDHDDPNSKYIIGGGWNKDEDSLIIGKIRSTWILHSGASIGFRLIKT